jgi:hypothetical protein
VVGGLLHSFFNRAVLEFYEIDPYHGRRGGSLSGSSPSTTLQKAVGAEVEGIKYQTAELVADEMKC